MDPFNHLTHFVRQGGPLEGVVNGSGATGALSPANKPYVKLGKALGVLLSPGLGAQVDKCQLQIITAGREMAERQACLRAGLLVGLLTGHGGEVNLLSAAPLAAELGVTVSLSEHTAGDPGAGGGTVTARLTTADGADTTAVTGTLRGEQATLLELNEAQFETGVTLQGRMMFFQEDGHPNALVDLITALAAADARPMSVLASVATSGVTQILAVRLSQEQPQLQQLDHTTLYLQTDF
ncbi:D-3-phosphoglycerate dehydrogenase [Amphibalanus amphitrite]|uniref:D-3-phosphoglycerate dehydrogenase n=1 Tax=Amphibalanus amphitrite TaxID=1232801 RepID=A0A6A4UXU7_AMPAM|nr:D-3-phosphoglycerate dehydrogenase [Amphibalanus amphitrite]